jgi:glycosyltransferase involved in cell wall biosynthesis
MLFSVVIPTYNRITFLQRTLETVWAQRFKDFEVIVVDDGSTDGTIDYLKSLSQTFSVLSQRHSGPGAARNLGAKKASGDYLAFLDSDDLWFPWTLETFAHLIKRHQFPSILSAQLAPFTAEAELENVSEAPPESDSFPDYISSHEPGFWVGSGMCVLRRDAFNASSGFTTEAINCEDHDLILRMGTAKGFVQVTRPVTLAWRRHAGSTSMDISRCMTGNLYLMAQERVGAYPGGAERAGARRNIITRHVRPIALACLRQGMAHEAWRLYRESFLWHLRLWRLRFLLGFPIKALAASAVRPAIPSSL